MNKSRLPATLWKSSYRFLMQHPWLFGLSVLGVALGVAVVISIDLANSSAEKAFALSTEAVTGNATHQVRGAAGPINEQVYRKLRIDAGIRTSAPVVEGYGTVQQADRTFHILGIDPLAEAPFRPYAGRSVGIELSSFIMNNRAGLISKPVADELNISTGDTLELSIEGNFYPLEIIGLIEPNDERSRRALESLILVDISTAQQLLNMSNKLSRIDLILSSDKNMSLDSINAILPDGATVVRSQTRSETVEQMTRAFEFNLQALSMLALLVGMFLIYNTMTFSVVQRRSLIGRYRAIGVSRSEIMLLILGEALVIGLLGTAAGLALGIVLAQALMQLVTQTINDLYFVLNVQQLSFEAGTFLKAGLLGIGATLLAALWPAREAAGARVSTVLRRSTRETSLQESANKLGLYGLLSGIAGGLIILIPGQGILIGYLSLLCIIIGFALMMPWLITWTARLLRPVYSAILGLIGRMSVRGVVTELSRTSVAITALVVAVAATIGVGVMIESFRTTVSSWLEAQLQADIYVQPPSAVSVQGDATLNAELADTLRNTPGVAFSHSVRTVNVRTQFGVNNLVAAERDRRTRDSYELKSSTDRFWDRFGTEPVVSVSEAYAYKHAVGLNDTLWLQTDRGTQFFTIGSIYFDYTSDQGVITVSRSVYDRYFDDPHISGLALYTDRQTDTHTLLDTLRQRAGGIQDVFIRSNRGLREASMNIFDRTFTVTIVLRLLAILVAFVGVLTAFMALQLERSRELAVLRANGMTPGQLWGYVTSQTSVMGLMAGLFSIPLGLIMAYILVYVINLRSFGWTLQISIQPEVLIQAVVLAFLAALLAGLYPSWKMAQANPADALRNE